MVPMSASGRRGDVAPRIFGLARQLAAASSPERLPCCYRFSRVRGLSAVRSTRTAGLWPIYALRSPGPLLPRTVGARGRSASTPVRCTASCSVSSVWRSGPGRWPRLSPSHATRGVARRGCCAASPTTRACCATRIASSAGDARRGEASRAGRRVAARQLPPRRRRDARDPARPAAPATTASCRSWPPASSPARPASTRWRSSCSATATRGSTRSGWTGSSTPTRPWRRSSIGELWAWPSMLKLALIEHLRRLADELIESPGRAPGGGRALRRLRAARTSEAACRRCPKSFHVAFVEQLLQRMREYGAGAAGPAQAARGAAGSPSARRSRRRCAPSTSGRR